MWLVGHFNHPSMAPRKQGERHNDFQQFRYAPGADRCMAMVELRDAGEEECYIAMLNNGWHVGAAGDEDKHSPEWGQGPTWTVVLARELTRESIIEAALARRTYSSADRDLRIDFSVDGEDMGSRIARPAGSVRCEVRLSDPTNDTVKEVDLLLDGTVVASARPDIAHYTWVVAPELKPGEHYCFVRVRQSGDRTSWSSPVWVSAYALP